jgi:hypothetical protein
MRLAPLVLVLIVLTGCGKTSATRAPTSAERTAIVNSIAAKLGPRPSTHLHLDIPAVRISRADPHFASAAIDPRNAQGRRTTDTGVIVLMKTGGQWIIVLGPGTAFPEECTQPTPKPVRDLMCPNPFSVLGV